jgi:hypothetical protein
VDAPGVGNPTSRWLIGVFEGLLFADTADAPAMGEHRVFKRDARLDLNVGNHRSLILVGIAIPTAAVLVKNGGGGCP